MPWKRRVKSRHSRHSPPSKMDSVEVVAMEHARQLSKGEQEQGVLSRMGFTLLWVRKYSSDPSQ